MAETYKVADGFADTLVACYVIYPEKFIARGDLIKPEYFEKPLAASAIRAISSYRTKFGRIPSWDILEQMVTEEGKRSALPEKEISDYLVGLSTKQTEDVDYVVEHFTAWCRKRSIINAVKHGIKCIKEDTEPEKGWVELFEKAISVGQNLGDMGYILNDPDTVDKVIDRTLGEGGGVKTGIPLYDNIWKFGWGPGWLITLLAPPKRYKTITAINIALSMASHGVGADVIYYACEITQELTVLRAIYNLAGMTEEDLVGSAADFKERAKRAIDAKLGGKVLIKGFPLGTASIADLESHASMAVAQLGLNLKSVFIDYADTVLAPDPSAPQHVQQADVYKAAIAMGQRKKCCIVMPDRCKADAVDKLVPDMNSIQGAFAKSGITDIGIGLYSTPAEYAANKMRHFVFINRHGPAQQHFSVTVDPARCKVSVDEEIPYDPDAMAETPQRGGRGGSRTRDTGMPGELISEGF